VYTPPVEATPPYEPPTADAPPPARGPRVPTSALAIGGAAVAVLLVAVVVVRLLGGSEAPADQGGAAAKAQVVAATATASPDDTPAATPSATPEATATAAPSPEATLPETPSDDAIELAAQIDRAEEVLHDSSSSAEDQAAAGRFEQMATRRLNAADSRFRRAALGAMGEDAHATMRATTNAAKAIAVVVEPQKRFPKWRIVSPPPAARLLRYFESAEARTGVPWEYLAAIQFVETKFGRIDGVSTAGARGPMQFIPATWARYGRGDIEDQRDSINAAARYLVANGAPGDMPGALYHYNPSQGYVRAIGHYAKRMQDDRQAFFGFYHWQVLYKHVRGTMILPEGYPKVRPAPLPVQ
jgi:membrane-bound lytic murein transglycosylase B